MCTYVSAHKQHQFLTTNRKLTDTYHRKKSNRAPKSLFQATDPTVYQTRATKTIPPYTLVLAPWSPFLTERVRNKKGGFDPIKAPQFLHPALPHHEVISVKSATDEEPVQLISRSPLAQKAALTPSAPPAFWTVLATEQSKVNMEKIEMTVPVATPMPVAKGLAKRKKVEATVEAPPEKIVASFNK